jgi:membrane protein YqaA with SNARE-associated domain
VAQCPFRDLYRKLREPLSETVLADGHIRPDADGSAPARFHTLRGVPAGWISELQQGSALGECDRSCQRFFALDSRAFAWRLMFDFSAESGFVALFFASFIAATVLPGGSELVLIAVIHRHPEALLSAVAVATVGNTLGGLTSYWVGRLIPNRVHHKSIIYLHKYGYWALLFSWVPLFGDALSVAAGWLRLNPWISLAALAVGKLFRYIVVAGGWAWFEALVLR